MARRATHPFIRLQARTNYNGPIIRDELGPCWVWTGAVDRKRYGLIRSEGRNLLTHRVGYIGQFGEIPDTTPRVLHRCDNPPCWRRSHLFSGTTQVNNQDMSVKGRSTQGAGEKREADSGRCSLNS